MSCLHARVAQEAEDGHSEEMAALREARDDLKAQLKAAKAQAYESSSITQVLRSIWYTLASQLLLRVYRFKSRPVRASVCGCVSERDCLLLSF